MGHTKWRQSQYVKVIKSEFPTIKTDLCILKLSTKLAEFSRLNKDCSVNEENSFLV